MAEAAGGRWRHFDHTGDVGIDAEAPDLDSLFACCASALFDVLAGPGPWIPSAARSLAIDAADREILLQRWLRELLYLHDADRWIFCGFEVKVEGREGGGWRLEGTARGEKFDPSRHRLRTEIKAVTYHQLSVRLDSEGTWRARVIFDI